MAATKVIFLSLYPSWEGTMTTGRPKAELGSICQLAAVIAKQIKSYPASPFLHLYLIGYGLYFLLATSGFTLRSLIHLEFIFVR